MKICVIDATIRKNSRTKKLLDYFLKDYNEKDITYLKLLDLNLKPLDFNMLYKREEAIRNNDFKNDILYYANKIKSSDILVYATPYYDLSFSSLLKLFIENANIADYLFHYDEHGNCISNCKCKKSYYITTSGSLMKEDYGYNYIKEVNEMFYGIKKNYLIKAENLDVIGFNEEEELKKSYQMIDSLRNH